MLRYKYKTMLFVLFNNRLITNNHYEVIIQNELINNTLRLIEKKSTKMLNKLSEFATFYYFSKFEKKFSFLFKSIQVYLSITHY